MTRRLKAGREGADVDAVADVQAFRNRQYVEDQTPALLGDPPLSPYLTLTTDPLDAGVYEVTINFLATGSNSGSQIQADLFVDGVSFGGPLFNFGVADAVQSFALAAIQLPPFTAGVHVISLRTAQPTSPGTVTMITAAIKLERVE